MTSNAREIFRDVGTTRWAPRRARELSFVEEPLSDTRRSKVTRHKVAVSIDRDGSDDEQLAYMFIAPAQRVTDVLNDEREFLPFERPDGSVFVVAKRTIRCITPMEMGRLVNEKDPYDLLGITLTATDEEVDEAYRNSIAAVHPDRVTALGLPPDFLEMATRRAGQLSDAFRKIKALRKAELAGMEH
jgi:DnaJ-domain-containing protein 1